MSPELRTELRRNCEFVRLDADVVHWLKETGKGYKTRLNAILRREMEKSKKKAT